MRWLARLLGSWRALRQALKNRMNRSRLASCGPRSHVYGTIDARGGTCDIQVGADCWLHGLMVVEQAKSRIRIGNNVFVGASTIIDCVHEIVLEDDVEISYECLLMDSDNHSHEAAIRRSDLAERMKGEYDWNRAPGQPVRIGKGAWVGARSIILKGVTVGEGSIVGAGSVVTKDVEPFTVVAGNPARVIRRAG